ncbi:MAG TPA: cyclic pyranopterin monophosphate synthase MoaC [Gemmatimonadales bacterium]|nr:cyclic pyranopterin monophosphate synthase MoaC [Gemmatimonadales bacterium]
MQPPGLPKLSHIGPGGEAAMVDVSQKSDTVRVARASGSIRMASATLQAVISNEITKGDVKAVARVAAVMAAKRTAELIPLCHPLPLYDVQVEVLADEELPGLRVEAETKTVGRTGVEMEALTAVSVALLTIWDMVKGVDSGLEMTEISLMSKTGGKPRS